MKATNRYRRGGFSRRNRSALRTLLAGSALFLWAVPATAAEWTMWGRTPDRNMVSPDKNPPTDWDVDSKKNVRWSGQLGSQSYGNPVVTGGLVIVGTNNEARRDPRYTGDGGALKIFRESDGKFLWQRFSDKLKAEIGRAHV